MGKSSPWITPFTKQCFVTTGVAFSMADCGLAMAYTTILLPQLQRPDSIIPVDDSAISWISAIGGFALIPSNVIAPIIMGKYGRRVSNIVSIVPNIIGWLVIASASNITSILIARLLQGFSMSMAAMVGSVLIAEYTSPINRGAFLSTMSLAGSFGAVCVQTVGLYTTWQITALACACFAFVDLVIVLYSPESPSWLIEKGRIEKGKKVFRWLRGNTEEDELRQLIAAATLLQKSKPDAQSRSLLKKLKSNLTFCMETIRRNEFYKPILIITHLLILFNWSGIHVLITYFIDIIHFIVGDDIRLISFTVISAGVLRIFSNLLSVYIIKILKRKTILIVTIGMNIFVLLATALYVYAKQYSLLAFDHPSIGILLIHLHVFSVTTGAGNLPLVIAGEILPLKFRSLAFSICFMVESPIIVITLKSVPLMFKTMGFYGAYCTFAVITSYCLIVSYVLLPETKNRTLLDIEDEFRGRQLIAEELQCFQTET